MWDLVLARRADRLLAEGLLQSWKSLRGLVPLQQKRESETNSQLCCRLPYLSFLRVCGFVSDIFLLVHNLQDINW